MSGYRILRVLAASLVALAVSSPGPVTARSPASSSAWNCSIVTPDSTLTATRRVLAVTPVAANAPAGPGRQLRIALGRLLAEHTFVTMESMRSIVFRTPDADALHKALDANTADLQAAIASVYGAAAGTTFQTLWGQHVDSLLLYAHAKADGNEPAAAQELTALSQYLDNFEAFLLKANPQLDAATERRALQLHVKQLTDIATMDYQQAYASERHAFEHMFAMGDRIALAIDRQFPARFPDANVAFSPAADLELTLDRLLGEHLVLAAEVMRAGLARSPDFDAARGALAANTKELSGAIGGIYGDDAGVAFEKVWANHIDAYLAFIGAVASGDPNARADSLAKLHAYHDQIAAFLATANPFLKREDVAVLIQRHVQALIAQVEAAAAGDHDRTVATVHGAYGQTFEVGKALAAAFSRQFPDRFADVKELPPTDSAPPDGGSRPGPWPVVAVVAGSALLWVASRRRTTTARAMTNPAPNSVWRRTRPE